MDWELNLDPLIMVVFDHTLDGRGYARISQFPLQTYWTGKLKIALGSASGTLML
jgi:hypothetical protein